MTTPRQNNLAASEKRNAPAPVFSRSRDNYHIRRTLSENGLNPNDYIFSPSPDENEEGNQFQQQTTDRVSAFSHYPHQSENHQSKPISSQQQQTITFGRPLTYVQAPPPPPAAPPAQPSQAQRQQGPPPPPPQQQRQPPPQSQQQQQQQQQPSLPRQQPPPPPITTRQAPEPYRSAPQSPHGMSQQQYSPQHSHSSPPHFDSRANDSRMSAEHYLRQIDSSENPPVKVVKPNTQNVIYKKEIRIRYLQPPTPAPPAPIIIREKHVPPVPPQSPLLIRERKPQAHTPPPLTIRERPPTPPAPLEPYIIEKNLPAAPPQPRQIIIERLPTPPPKPRTVIFEKWLPYKKVKRPVLLQKAPVPPPIKPTRNVIIEYEPLKAFTVRRVIEEGVFRVDPHQYMSYHTQGNRGDSGDVRIVERIEDLPPPSEQLMRVLSEYNHPHHSSTLLSSHEHPQQHGSDHIPSSIQHLLGGGTRPTSNIDQLTNVSRSSSTPAYRQERVLSTGQDSAIPSPTIIPLQRSGSKVSPRQQHHTPHDSPTRASIDDAY